MKANHSFSVHVNGQMIERESPSLPASWHQMVFDAAPVAMLLLDGRTRIVEVNNTLQKMFGVEKEELMAQQPGDGLHCAVSVQSGEGCGLAIECAHCGFRNNVKKVLATGQAVRQVETNAQFIIQGQPVTVWVELSANPVDINGERHVLVCFNNITERKLALRQLKASEEKFRAFVESANDIVYSLTKEGVFTYVSPTWTDVLGHDVSEVLGHSFIPFVHPDDTARCAAFLQRVISTDQKQGGITYRVRHKNGDWRWHISNAAPYHVVSQDQSAFMGIAHDITPLKELSEELEASNAVKDKFFSIIAHDLKGPFNNAIALLELLREDIANGHVESPMLNHIEFALKRGKTLLENLLEWARLQTGQMQFVPNLQRAAQLLEDTLVMVEPLAFAKNIRLEAEWPAVGAGCEVWVDSSMIKSVLRNLVSNAIKFTYPGGVVRVGYRQEGEDEICFYIIDNGIGIEATRLEKVFQLGQAVPGLGTSHEKGTGLGLILCKDFVERHHGRIWAESEEGKGSTFCFTLPLGSKS